MTSNSHAGALRGAIPGVAALAVVAVLLASCSSSKPTENVASSTTAAPSENSVGAVRTGPADTKPRSGGKVSYGILAEPEGLDPTRYAFSQDGHSVASAVFDPLATLDKDGNAIPYLATGFEPSADFKSWTIALPTGVTFHDDSPLNADAVIQDMEAYKSSAITGGTMNGIVSSITKKDDTHVTVNLKQAMRAFPLLLTTQVGYIPAPVMLNSTDLAKKPVGSGPFIFDSHVDGKSWSFKKNPNYRQKDLPHLDAIEFRPVPDDAERNKLLRDGDLDLINTISGPQILELRANPDLKIVENRHGDKAFLMMNTTTPPFNSLNARKAVAYATDSAKWRKDIHADVATPANSPFGPGQPGYLKDNGYPSYNLDEAKKAVAAYKSETGKDLEFSFLAVQDPQNAAVSQGFATQYGAAGMKVTVKQLPQINLLASVATGSYEMSQFRLWGAPNPDGETHFYSGASIVPGISVNFPRYASPVVDEGIAEALSTPDAAKRTAAYERISKDLGANVPYIWLGQNDWVVAANARVNGIDGALNGSIATVGPKTWIQSLSVG